MDMDMGHFRLMSLPSVPSDVGDNESEGARCGGGAEFERKMSEALGQPNQSNKILAFREKAPSIREGMWQRVRNTFLFSHKCYCF